MGSSCDKVSTALSFNDSHIETQLHSYDDNPIVEKTGYNLTTYTWYEHGKKHRTTIDPKTGLRNPAERITYGSNSKVLGETWFENGLEHRDELTPSGKELFSHFLNTNGIITFTWKKNGKYYKRSLDENGQTRPNKVRLDVGTWYNEKGQIHRDEVDKDGMSLPAMSGKCIKAWYKNGELHRFEFDSDGFLLPAIISPEEVACYLNGRKLDAIEILHHQTEHKKK